MQEPSFPVGSKPLFRGGPTLIPRPGIDVIVDRNTGLLRTDRGVSLFDEAAKVERFGGAYQVESIPVGLVIRQRGRAIGHYELMPVESMTFERYASLLQQVVLRLVLEE